jgi:Domain of unknown function (DUF3067)
MMPDMLFALQLTEEEHLNRLDFIAAALRCEAPLTSGCIACIEPWYAQPAQLAVCVNRQWGMVGHVKDTISAAKNRPRVGKAISVMLDVDPSIVNEWFA